MAASVVTAIGFSLLSVGATSFGGGSGAEDFGSAKNLILGTITLVCCIGFNIFAKSYWKQLSVLFGLIVGYIVAVCMGMVDFSGLSTAQIVSLPQILPIKPTFNIGAIISVLVIFLVSATETIGDTSALASSGLNREVCEEGAYRLNRRRRFCQCIVGTFRLFADYVVQPKCGTCFNDKSRKQIYDFHRLRYYGFGRIVPYVRNITCNVPEAVLGGCTLMMFGNIVISGLQMIAKCGFSQRNIIIAALSLSIGLGFTQVPEIFSIFPQIIQNVFAENCVAVVFLVSIILNLVLPKNMRGSSIIKKQQTILK